MMYINNQSDEIKRLSQLNQRLEEQNKSLSLLEQIAWDEIKRAKAEARRLRITALILWVIVLALCTLICWDNL